MKVSIRKLLINKKITKSKNSYMYFDNELRKLIMAITIEVSILLSIYILYCIRYLYLLNSVWYIYLFTFISCIIFIYSYLDIRIGLINKKFKNNIPKTIRLIRYYLVHTKNIDKAMDRVLERTPKNTKKVVLLIQNAIQHSYPSEELKKLKARLNSSWSSILFDVILQSKLHGNDISKNLNELANVVEFQNIQQEYDNVELLGGQIFVFLLPLIGIPFVQLFNDFLFEAMEAQNIYTSLSSSIEVAKILMVTNILTLFLSWIRKNS